MTWTLWPFRGLLRSKMGSLLECSYMTSYPTSIDTFSLSRTVFEIFDFIICGFDLEHWILEVTRGKIFSLFEGTYTASYLVSIDNFSPSHTVFEIFDFKNFGVWPWPLICDVHMSWVTFSLFKDSHMTSYLTPFDIFSSISCRIQDNRLRSFRGLTLNYDIRWLPEVKNVLSIRKPIHNFPSIFYWQFLSISYRFSDIRLRSFWGVTSTFGLCWFPEVEYFASIRKHIRYILFKLLLTLSLSRTVFEIFDCKISGVWPWPMTFAGYLRLILFPAFESTYVTP